MVPRKIFSSNPKSSSFSKAPFKIVTSGIRLLPDIFCEFSLGRHVSTLERAQQLVAMFDPQVYQFIASWRVGPPFCRQHGGCGDRFANYGALDQLRGFIFAVWVFAHLYK